MNNLREFIDALFSSETRDQKMKRGMNIFQKQKKVFCFIKIWSIRKMKP